MCKGDLNMSVKIYPLTEVDFSVKNYDIKINGIHVTPDTARVSAMPFNRRWPGHQRQFDQTELVNFLSFAMDEPVKFEITPKDAFEKVIIRPRSLNITPEIKDGVIRFTLEKPSYFTVEPFGRHNALHIFADDMPNYDIDLNDENVIYYGKGFHEAGTIELKSNQTLFIDEGAVVYACIKIPDAENIKILGRGILDNSHNKEIILFEANEAYNSTAVKNATRQHTVQIEYCTNVLIDGITIRDSLVYNIRPLACEKLTIKNVKLIGNWRYNSDGIDMHNCVDVLVEHCFLRTFDDSICIKGFDCYYADNVEEAVKNAMYRNGKSYDVFKNTKVTDCTIWNDWGKSLEIGAETRAEEIYNITFEDCNIVHVLGAVLDCCNIDYADVHDIVYRNINVEYDDIIPKEHIQTSDEHKYEDFPVNTEYVPKLLAVEAGYHHEYSAGGQRRGKNNNILFENIHLYGSQPIKMYFKGYDEDHKTSNITVKNLYYNEKLVTKIPEENIEKNKFVENINIL